MRSLTVPAHFHSWLIRAFFLGYLALGLWITPDYGVSWDEPIQRRHGIVTADYINRFLGLQAPRYNDEFELETYEFRHYGVLFTTLAFGLERMLGLETWRQQHLMRHYLVFLLFWLGTIGFYQLLRYRYGNWKWILAGMLFLLLCPRLFAHSFFNVKDAVLVAAVLWAMYTMVRFLDTPRWTWALAHGFASAIAIDIRIVAVIIPALTLGWWLIRLLSVRPSLGKALFPLGLYGLITAVVLVIGWPYLWANPLANFLEAYRVMGHYQWGGEVRLWGEFLYPAGGLAWWYLPSWMLITIPVGITLFFLAGLGRIVYRLARPLLRLKFQWFQRRDVRTDAILLSLFVAPVAIVLLKRSVLYDDWRQMYFVYPAFALVALSGVEGLQRRLRLKWVMPLLVALTLGGTLIQMVRYHPLEHVYFNFLAGSNRELRFDQDYWGLSYKQAFETLLEKDTSAVITFYSQNFPGTANHAFLPKEKEARLKQVWEEKGAKYYLSNFRERRELHRYRKKEFPLLDPVFFIYAGRTPVLGVYEVGKYWDRVEGEKGNWKLID